MNKPLQEIPERVTVNDALVGFVKNAGCPDLEVELFVTEFEFAGAKARLDRFKLMFRETSQELSQLLCVWAKRIKSGRSHLPLAAINRRLKGEKYE